MSTEKIAKYFVTHEIGLSMIYLTCRVVRVPNCSFRE